VAEALPAEGIAMTPFGVGDGCFVVVGEAGNGAGFGFGFGTGTGTGT